MSQAAALAPALSVVIPTHDTRALTLRCLESFAGFEAERVLVDDGSHDGTAEAVAERFPSVRILRNDSAQGFTRAANRGLAHASGELLLLLNSDTEASPEALARIRAAFARTPQLGVATPLLCFPDGAPQWSAGATPTPAWLFLLASGLATALARLPFYRRLRPLARPGPVDWVSGAAMAIRRAAWQAAGPLDERFACYCQDLDFCLRAGAAGFGVAVLPEAQVIHHGGATIGRLDGALGSGTHPGLLWSDLLRWAAKHAGDPLARRCKWALLAGARLRIGWRQLTAPGRGAAWRHDTAALAAALHALEAPAGVASLQPRETR